MLLRLFFIIYFFSFSNFSSLYSSEGLSLDSNHYFSLEKLSEYRTFLKELVALEVKKRNDEIVKGIKENFDDPYLLGVLRNLQNTYIQIEKNQEIIEKSIPEYENIIDIYLVKKYDFDPSQAKNQVSVKAINKLCVEMGKFESELKNVEKKIALLKKDDEEQNKHLEKLNIVLSDKLVLQKDSYRELSKTHGYKFGAKGVLLQEELTESEKYLQYLLKKVRKFQFSIAEAKKYFIKERIKEIKNYFQLSKKYLSIDEKALLKEKETYIANEKKIFESRDATLKSLDLLGKEPSDEKELMNSLEHNIERIIYLMKIFNQSENKELSSLIENLLVFIKKYVLKTSIFIDDFKIYINKKNFDIFYGWYVSTLSEVNLEFLKKTLESLNYKATRSNIAEKKAELKNNIEKINAYMKLLNTIMQVDDKDLAVKGYKQEIKEVIDQLLLKHDLILNITAKLTNLTSITGFLEEELKAKTFWARSEYSISFFKLKNFLPEMKLFLIELERQFFPYLKKLAHFFSTSNANAAVNISLVVFIVLGLLLLGYVYKKIISMMCIALNRMKEQTYYVKKCALILHVFSEQSIFLYFWFSLFILIYYKFLIFQYTQTLFYLISIPVVIYFVQVFLNSTQEHTYFSREDSLSWSSMLQKFFIDRFFINSIISLFFLREAVVSLVQTNTHEVILAAQFIFIQIQLIILLKKNYIIENIAEIKFINYKIKEFIEQYYQIFIGTLIALIVMSNPYVGYGKQVLYVVTRSIMTILLVPLFEKIFEIIKNKSLMIFFTFEGDEAKNKIKIAKIIYTVFLACLYFSIIFFAAYIILRGWGYLVEPRQFLDLFYQNLLPENHILSNEKITSLSISTLFIVVFHITRGYLVSVFINRFIFSKILHPIIIGQALQHTIMTLAKYIVLFTAFVIGLYAAGLQSIITKLGAIIIGIGFAIKEPFADFFSYFIILIQRPIRVGDCIRINRINSNDPEVIGIVRSIGSRATVIRQKNSQTLIIPNSIILTRSICNWTYHKSGFTSADDLFFIVSRSISDIDQIRGLITKVVEGHPAVIKNPIPLVRCEAITELGYQIMVRAYIPTEKASDQWDIASQIRILIIKKFEAEHIAFAIPEFNIEVKRE